MAALAYAGGGTAVLLVRACGRPRFAKTLYGAVLGFGLCAGLLVLLAGLVLHSHAYRMESLTHYPSSGYKTEDLKVYTATYGLAYALCGSLCLLFLLLLLAGGELFRAGDGDAAGGGGGGGAGGGGSSYANGAFAYGGGGGASNPYGIRL
jgi:uncharacterized membrane protein YgcG